LNTGPQSDLSPASILQDAIRRLQATFLQESRERTAPLRDALAAVDASEVVEWPLVHATAHKLAGLGGSIDLPAVSNTARALEQLISGWPAGRTLIDRDREQARANMVAVLQCVTPND
jgi:HPt (histidine-containing phosphotransfer) domain-containing protein